MDFAWLAEPEAWAALLTLTLLEIVLGIDNIIFISILVGRLPEHQRARGRIIGLSLAMVMRLALLLSIAWIMRLTTPLFEILGQPISGRDLILVGGGLFLLWKAVHEIHSSLETVDASEAKVPAAASFGAIMVQIALIDIVFSLDSVITAVGLVDHVSIMAIAIILAVGIMMVGAKPIGDFVDAHPTVKMLALSFLVLVGVVLIAEGFGQHIPKGYIYSAMGFSVFVESLNLLSRRKRRQPVHLRQAYSDRTDDGG